MIRLKIEVLKLFLLDFVWDRKQKSKETMTDETTEVISADNPNSVDNKQ
jgi:hypothetical protein